MAKISAWMGLVAGAAIMASLALDLAHLDFAALGPAFAALLLAFGAVRTLRAQSGGLRLLCGAWGVGFGEAWFAPTYNFPAFVPGMLAVAAPVFISAAGLALVVLHQEKKRA